MKKLIKLFWWLTFNGMFVYALYGCFFLGAAGWQTVVKFFTITYFILHMLGIFGMDDIIERGVKDGGTPIPVYLNFAFDIVVTGVFAYFGWIGYATMYFLGSCVQLYMISEVKDRLKK